MFQINTKTTSFESAEDVINFLASREIDNIIIVRYDKQIFGWPAGRSERFTTERGRIRQVIHPVSVIPPINGVATTIKVADKAALMNAVELAPYTPFWEVWSIE